MNGFGDEAWKLENGFGILGRVGICLVLEVMEFADDGVFGLDEEEELGMVEAVVTKDELQHVARLCKSEVDSMGRITAGALRVLKLEGSLSQSAMNQLSNL
ncbi:hypothetical protein Tco_1340770, partial [Tanacetum coccineum]